MVFIVLLRAFLYVFVLCYWCVFLSGLSTLLFSHRLELEYVSLYKFSLVRLRNKSEFAYVNHARIRSW